MRTSKTYLRDGELTHALLDIETWEDVLGQPVAGASWEGFVIKNISSRRLASGARRTSIEPRMAQRSICSSSEAESRRWRSRSSARPAPSLSRGFHSAREAIERSYLVHGDRRSSRRADGVTAIGLVGLMRKLAIAADVNAGDRWNMTRSPSVICNSILVS